MTVDLPLLELNGVSYRHTGPEGRETMALTGMSMAVNAGEQWAVLGRNGSGKSTLLAVMAGLLEPSGGTVRFLGRSLEESGVICGDRIALVMADADQQIVGATVEDDLAFGLLQTGVPGGTIKKRIDEVLELLRLEGFRHFPPAALSTVERCMLALAGALVVEPDLLLLDETASCLDRPARLLFEDAIGRLAERGGAIVRVTHDVSEAVHCDRAVVLSQGRPVEQGVPTRVLSEPDRLREWGLSVPPALELSAALKVSGRLAQAYFSPEGLVAAICR